MATAELVITRDIRPIARYEAPDWFVRPGAPASPWLADRVRRAHRDGHTRVLDRAIAGWGPYTAIVRVEADPTGLDPDSIDGDYLVAVAP